MTKCLIFIQETKDDKPVSLFDVYLLETAVKRYHIGLGQKHRKYTLTSHNRGDLVKSVPYPLIQIDKHGLIAMKCPHNGWNHGFIDQCYKNHLTVDISLCDHLGTHLWWVSRAGHGSGLMLGE